VSFIDCDEFFFINAFLVQFTLGNFAVVLRTVFWHFCNVLFCFSPEGRNNVSMDWRNDWKAVNTSWILLVENLFGAGQTWLSGVCCTRNGDLYLVC